MSSSMIEIAWIDNASDEEEYVVEHCTDGVSFALYYQTYAPNIVLLDDTGLDPGTTYYFRAVAQNSFGRSNGAILSLTTGGNAPAKITPESPGTFGSGGRNANRASIGEVVCNSNFTVSATGSRRSIRQMVT